MYLIVIYFKQCLFWLSQASLRSPISFCLVRNSSLPQLFVSSRYKHWWKEAFAKNTSFDVFNLSYLPRSYVEHLQHKPQPMPHLRSALIWALSSTTQCKLDWSNSKQCHIISRQMVDGGTKEMEVQIRKTLLSFCLKVHLIQSRSTSRWWNGLF